MRTLDSEGKAEVGMDRSPWADLRECDPSTIGQFRSGFAPASVPNAGNGRHSSKGFIPIGTRTVPEMHCRGRHIRRMVTKLVVRPCVCHVGFRSLLHRVWQ